MNKTLANIICLFIPKKKNRRRFREKYVKNNHINETSNINETLNRLETLTILQLLKPIFDAKLQIGGGEVLLVELCPGHGEVLLSSVKYFLDLGYSVHVLVSQENYASLVFCRCNFPENKFKIFLAHRDILENGASFYYLLSLYKYVLINTLDIGCGMSMDEWYSKYINVYNRHNTYFIEHYVINMPKYSIVDRNKIFNLYNFPYQDLDKNIKFGKLLSPIFYGNIKITCKNKDTIKFFSCGRFDKNARNYDILVDSINKLIKNNITNFKVICVGRAGDSTASLENLKLELEPIKDFIEIRGEVPYPELFDLMEESDYILAMLDPNNTAHREYLWNKITGNFGLTVGFQKPMLINEEFGKFYKLNDDKAINYKGDELYEAMVEAINLDNGSYKAKQDELGKYKEQLYAESLNNFPAVRNNL